eukprot:Skav222357  [mRNA]  locus=scaffold5844:74349:82456:- [translate_table: standard]
MEGSRTSEICAQSRPSSVQVCATGGGKGGTLMASLDTVIVKELSKGGDAMGPVDAGEHLQSGKSNCVGKGPFKALYDLKGCADDKTLEKDGVPIPAVHKRIWNLHMWSSCCWSSARRRYYNGKVEARKAQLPVTCSQKDAVLEALRRDVSWLACQRLMDYSLLVAVKDFKEESTDGLPAGQPYIRQTKLDGRKMPWPCSSGPRLCYVVLRYTGSITVNLMITLCTRVCVSLYP